MNSSEDNVYNSNRFSNSSSNNNIYNKSNKYFSSEKNDNKVNNNFNYMDFNENDINYPKDEEELDKYYETFYN